MSKPTTQTTDLEELKRVARAVTPGDIDSAPDDGEYGYKEAGKLYNCPACGGGGEVEGSTFCNFDDKPLGVQFFGIGAEPAAWEHYFRAFRPAVVLSLLDRLSKAEGERDRFKPTPSLHEHLFSVVYRQGAPTAADYNEAIEALLAAKHALTSGDSMGCRVCEDGGHGANMCHHNPLLLARKWTAASRFWQCWHCGFVATNDAEGREHFGHHDGDEPSCVRAELEARAQTAEKEAAELRDLLAQRTADIAKAQPDPNTRRVAAEVLDRLAGLAEAHWACADTDAERIEATALEMLVAWQREPAGT